MTRVSEGVDVSSFSDSRERGRIGPYDPHALAVSRRYSNLKMPVIILAGAQDRLVDTDDQSARLHS
jgi:hypothetical protein